MARTFTPTRVPPLLPGVALLGLHATTLLELGEAVQEGFPPATLDHLAAHLGLPVSLTLGLIGLSPRTYQVHRHQNRPLKPEVSARHYHLARVTDAAATYFGEAAAAHTWLQTPRRTFGQRTPLAFALLPGGVEYVTTMLFRLEQGVYS